MAELTVRLRVLFGADLSIAEDSDSLHRHAAGPGEALRAPLGLRTEIVANWAAQCE